MQLSDAFCSLKFVDALLASLKKDEGGMAVSKKYVNSIICGDAVTVMKALPARSFQLAVTSPPYNIKNSTGNGLKNGSGGKWPKAALINGYNNHDDCMPHEDYVGWQRACLDQMMRLLSDDGAIFYNHKWRVQAGLLQDRNDIVAGFPVRQILIWRRKGGINFNPSYFLPTYEVVYLITKPSFRLAPRANAFTDVWDITQESNNPHPAPFPLEFAERCIAATTAQIVLDPFVGSGTTAVAAKRLQRDFVGIDISKEYCDLATQRLRRTQPLEDGSRVMITTRAAAG